ncbi:MAG: NAD-dependent epimerase/dehydratase family protein [Candidatus Omnitrophota bacterium]
MNILITGSTGFIGQNLVKRLLKLGHRCRCLVRDADKAKKMLGQQSNLDFHIGDITSPETLSGTTDNIDCVFHLAALMGHDLPSESAFKKFRAVNVEGTKNILNECCKNPSIQKIIHISSTAAYGILKDHRINENTECNPYTPYQRSKHESDHAALSYIEQGLPITIIRPCMIYGPGFKGDFFTMTKVAKKGFYPKIGLGKNLAPSLYIDDLIDALILAVDHAKTGETYLIGPTRSFSQKEILNVIKKFLNKKIFYVYFPVFLIKFLAWLQEKLMKSINKKPVVTARNISSITHDRILDISKAKSELKYEPQIDLEEGLSKTLQWYHNKGLI